MKLTKPLSYMMFLFLSIKSFSQDTSPPSAPGNLSAPVVSNNFITLLWSASTDNVGILQYEVYVNWVWKANVSASTLYYTYTGLQANTSYSLNIIAKDPSGNFTASNTFVVSTTSTSASHVYYISASGNDNSSGQSPAAAWQSLDRVNAQAFQPEDQILFQKGDVFNGGLWLRGDGTAAKPITMASYGSGTVKPLIQGNGNVVDVIYLGNYNYWIVKDLEVTNYGASRGSYRSGVTLRSSWGSVVKGLTVSNMTIHHTNSMLDKGNEGAGIYLDAQNAGSSFDSILIENNYLYSVDRNGISQRTVGNADKSRHIIIRNNLLEDVGGDCIKLWGSIGGLIERNTVRGGMKRAVDASAGIWPFYSDSTLIQYNEVSGMERCLDGQAFDSDYLTTNSIFQYNYSHDNQGGFFLLCAPNTEISNGAIIRYNISQNDGIQQADYAYPGEGFNEGAIFTLGGHVTNSQIYNNTIYVKAGKNIPIVRSGSWDGGVPSANNFSNNIFYVEGTGRYIFSAGQVPVFENNVFYGNHVSPPSDAFAITAMPNLVAVNTGGNGLNTLDGYKFTTRNSIFLGKVMGTNGGFDFWNNSVSATSRPMVGAHEVPVSLNYHADYTKQESENTSTGTSVYPNPFSGSARIYFDGEKGLVEFQLRDVNGTLVEQGILNTPVSALGENLKPGVYMLQLKSENEMEKYKLVKCDE